MSLRNRLGLLFLAPTPLAVMLVIFGATIHSREVILIAVGWYIGILTGILVSHIAPEAKP